MQPDTVVIAAHAEVRNTETFEEEEAWGDGARFVERGPRATYFTYEVQTCGGGTSKCVFVTNEIFADGNLGCLAAADAFCQNFAEGSLAAPGTYKAWLSTSLEWPADGTRFSQASVRYKLVNGTTIANDWDDLVDGSLDAGIDVTQSGVELPPSFENWVWTGTLVSGDPSGQDCDGWLSSSSEIGNVGLALHGWFSMDRSP